MKLRLKYLLKPIRHNGLDFKILEMDEQFRHTLGSSCPIFSCKNKWLIHSEINPHIDQDEKVIYLRGHNRAYDNICAFVLFKNTYARDTAIAEIHEALKEWSLNWFKENGKG